MTLSKRPAKRAQTTCALCGRVTAIYYVIAGMNWCVSCTEFFYELT